MKGVEEIFSKCYKFFKPEKLVLHVFWKYQVSMWKCVKESSSIHWKFEVCVEERFLSCWKCELLSVSKRIIHIIASFKWNFKLV